MKTRTIRTEADIDSLSADLREHLGEGWTVTIERRRRTSAQNSALHVWLTWISAQLNDAGLDQRVVLAAMRDGTEIPWTPHSVKESLYKPILSAMTGKASTTKMDTIEPGEVAKVLGRWLGEKFGITAPAWPDRRGGDERD
jgi:hypothetical protein